MWDGVCDVVVPTSPLSAMWAVTVATAVSCWRGVGTACVVDTELTVPGLLMIPDDGDRVADAFIVVGGGVAGLLTG